MEREKFVNGIKDRASVIRLRTWTLTLALITALILYFLVQITTKQTMSWIDFALLCSMQILVYSIYFPDGDLFGQRNKTFIANKDAYNEKATQVNSNRKNARLREYCEVEFQERRMRYIENECGAIGITYEDYEVLKGFTKTEIKALEKYVSKKDEQGKTIVFSNRNKRRLMKLLFHDIPVERNNPETIMSAVENDGKRAIRDESVRYKRHAYIRKFLMAIGLGLIFAYIGYKLKDGIGFAEIISIVMYLTTIFSTAVMAYSSGETCSRVYKNRFYVELANFIDRFNEWDGRTTIITDTAPISLTELIKDTPFIQVKEVEPQVQIIKEEESE